MITSKIGLHSFHVYNFVFIISGNEERLTPSYENNTTKYHHRLNFFFNVFTINSNFDYRKHFLQKSTSVDLGFL